MPEKLPWYLKTFRIIAISFAGALLVFTSIASLMGVSMVEELNKDYYELKD